MLQKLRATFKRTLKTSRFTKSKQSILRLSNLKRRFKLNRVKICLFSSSSKRTWTNKTSRKWGRLFRIICTCGKSKRTAIKARKLGITDKLLRTETPTWVCPYQKLIYTGNQCWCPLSQATKTIITRTYLPTNSRTNLARINYFWRNKVIKVIRTNQKGFRTIRSLTSSRYNNWCLQFLLMLLKM
jgi:hypothetical protein